MLSRIITVQYQDPSKEMRLCTLEYDFNKADSRKAYLRFMGWAINNRVTMVVIPNGPVINGTPDHIPAFLKQAF